jgi:Tfp pilus assembly protein PilZ
MDRYLNRLKKRLTVRFGRDAADRLGFTEDISRTGIFVKTAQIIQPGSAIKIALELDRNETVQLEGTVVWAKKVPPELLRVAKKCGMGVRITRFVAGEAAYLSLFPEESPSPSR